MRNIGISINNLIAKAAKVISPLWPMQTIIARNPLQGLESLNIEDAIAFGETYLAGHTAIDESTSTAVNREMIKWCEVFLDEGQATILMPQRERGFYRAWSLVAPFDSRLRLDRNNDWLQTLPSEPEEAITLCLTKLGIPSEEAEEYLTHSLAELPGWAGYIKWRVEWQKTESGVNNPITLTDYLAVRLVITCALKDNIGKGNLKNKGFNTPQIDKDFYRKLKNREKKYLERLLKLILPKALNHNLEKKTLFRPKAQLVFCIDVRSEPLRKRIESEGDYETFGFAGFFGLPVSIHSYSADQIKDCCPVLLKPCYQVFEEPISEEKARISHHQKGRRFLEICRRFYQDLKYNFATPFALVETLGIWCGFWMALRTIMPVRSLKLKNAIQEAFSPSLATLPRIDIPLESQINIGESVLRTIGLTKNFSRLIVFCGHRSQTENNPYASALDCGACGANRGGPNGKILAVILNSQAVRNALLDKGISIPPDTLFVGAEHNTTTDEVIINDYGIESNTHREMIEKLKIDLTQAGIINSQYRSQTLGCRTSALDAKNHVLKRGSDWSEVRPEWGLARNAAFIVGPRDLTKEFNLEGRCFLHSYNWIEDEEGMSLETILTGPLVVAEWINTQYFFSTINNIAYGSGSKITQNITGKFGVMQGNGSDLMQGLPLQSVNMTDDLSYHEPMRLQVIIYAPRSKIDLIIEKHPLLKKLTFNQWIVMVAIDPIERKSYQLVEKTKWNEIEIEGSNVTPFEEAVCLPVLSPLGIES